MGRRIISQMIGFVQSRQRQARAVAGGGAGNDSQQTLPVGMRQMLVILHRSRELQLADVNRWPRFLFGKKLEEISQVEASELILHLELEGVIKEGPTGGLN